VRKLSLIVIAFVVAMAAIALAQQPRSAGEAIAALEKMGLAGPRCVKFDDTTYSVNATTQHNGKTYRCSAVYDQWMAKTSRVAWVQVP
jgi:hypothetical protein